MARVFLGIGANLDPMMNIRMGLARLAQDFKVVQVSPWYQSPALGFSGPDFINLVIEIESNMSVADLSAQLKQIETDFGRAANAVKYSSRALDVDILLVDDLCGEFDGIELPRNDIWQCAFVLKPLLDLVPKAICPKSGETFASYWPAVANQTLQLIVSDTKAQKSARSSR
ncbi:MAG: 2-amino-4-hydroxy-6-hydroxymethyldihydropteridine diphosphokinase [Thalassolituus sp.]|jgi:2-amino-4-hydroxy-6-hydroxymethyldihydropteridine diphosphokinase|uniref:2-amino-4-hydroxy-6-hydroxymethyldihydropteridine diphosphokinase n=1 Tax=Thalassolituus oleivorans MIL-1 TaxID=1298593 RepID=M5DNK9_9GAMM|nr:2-amino-4-hydroxy-6-hydroxymethyldihydropteridine diphosphokinase [Thalassolituus oleivorans]APR68151.1 2-amino-4-hydroxy-6-hydroxymethyldihydropteridine diphosphokinase [Thalassolituus oleivorans]MBQ0728842.1 2-amino-4-hydroxy-6-hydroxymethyldihydropteridine diphosphokinase [Thalassolituus oleivorans]MBQ0781294.1 2-amino-4-hydroxy-6-hydroxymethyldihydropteridine diphosphokinase [Thalassolituus oleivorans]MDF1642230.1 2-amino-4-hydroxy-6-hydroxymethyldihydropteridine diphosphokinase [Thalass